MQEGVQMKGGLIEADYLIVGSGAVGMAFADVLLSETQSSMVILDRHHGPGGHWNDAYPFVRLHQPSAYYGVNSRPLGGDGQDTSRLNPGMSDRATSAELLNYYEQLMRTLVASGRVQYFPMCAYVGDYLSNHTFTSLLGGVQRGVVVRRKVVDTTHLNTAVPSTHPPKYAVAPGVQCVPLNELPRLRHRPSGYVVVGAGKTGIDACLWLLDNGVAAQDICWIMPRDAWFVDRANVQPGEAFFTQSYGGFATQVETVAQAESIDDLFARLEATGQLLRLDRMVQPTMYHGAIVSRAELEELRTIRNIVRLGRVRRLEKDSIVLEHGSVPSDGERLYVDCSASGVAQRPSIPVFDGNKITPQMVRALQPTFSSAFIAHVEASVEDEGAKNELCTPIPMSDLPIHWLAMFAVNLSNQYRWSKNTELRDWIERSRLDAFSALARRITPTQTAKSALVQRYTRSAGIAAANVPALLSKAFGGVGAAR
jgi:hypothetical protein